MKGADCLFVPEDYFREMGRGELFPGGEDDESGRELEVDLGAGDGGFVVEMGRRYPERDFLAVERLLGRARKIARRAARAGVTNVKSLRLESAYTVEWLLPEGAVSRVHLLFPDPWPKRRHRGRRMVCREDFHRGLRRVLRPGGTFCFKTDDAAYFESGVKAMAASEGFEAREWEADSYYAETDFERQWRAEGRSLYGACWVKV
ncbi:MAG: tRNA (guanosine(46)-N7)-methyltransferase TrmB [Verrucomicrobiota bacterium]